MPITLTLYIKCIHINILTSHAFDTIQFAKVHTDVINFLIAQYKLLHFINMYIRNTCDIQLYTKSNNYLVSRAAFKIQVRTEHTYSKMDFDRDPTCVGRGNCLLCRL